MKELPFPRSGDTLPKLKARPKGEYRGVWPRTVGAVVWLGRKLGIRAAVRFHAEYHTVMGSVIYHPPGRPPSAGLYLHEGVHAWLSRKVGSVRATWLWLWRRHEAEAQCYAAEVLAGYRTPKEAAEQLADPIYATRVVGDVEAARLVIESMVFAWARKGWTREKLRALGETARA